MFFFVDKREETAEEIATTIVNGLVDQITGDQNKKKNMLKMFLSTFINLCFVSVSKPILSSIQTSVSVKFNQSYWLYTDE